MALFSTVFSTPRSLAFDGVTQISGDGAFAAPGECDDPEGSGSDYALSLSGDLSGCHYVFVEVSRCSPGRAYFEAGTEIFVGTYNGELGTFGTNYVFTGVYLDCAAFGGQIAGRCQHPITSGSGTDVFDGVAGRIDMRDDVESGTFSYRGHLSFGGTNSATTSSDLEAGREGNGLAISGSGC
jgi:hypothetical protein